MLPLYNNIRPQLLLGQGNKNLKYCISKNKRPFSKNFLSKEFCSIIFSSNEKRPEQKPGVYTVKCIKIAYFKNMCFAFARLVARDLFLHH